MFINSQLDRFMNMGRHFDCFKKRLILAGYLLAHPIYFAKYLRYIFFYGSAEMTINPYPGLPLRCSSPMELGMPWFSYAAIDFLEKHIKKNMKIFEWGCGGSTVFFSKRCESVYSIENDAGWYSLINQKLHAANLTNAHVIFLNSTIADGSFDEAKYIQSIGPSKYDVIVVDGAEFTPESRVRCFYQAEHNVADGGIIVIDDAQRYLKIRQQNNAKYYKIFRGVGPARLGVTYTDIYFY